MQSFVSFPRRFTLELQSSFGNVLRLVQMDLQNAKAENGTCIGVILI